MLPVAVPDSSHAPTAPRRERVSCPHSWLLLSSRDDLRREIGLSPVRTESQRSTIRIFSARRLIDCCRCSIPLYSDRRRHDSRSADICAATGHEFVSGAFTSRWARLSSCCPFFRGKMVLLLMCQIRQCCG